MLCFYYGAYLDFLLISSVTFLLLNLLKLCFCCCLGACSDYYFRGFLNEGFGRSGCVWALRRWIC